MKFITRIPTHLNDGTPVSDEQMQAILMMYVEAFGGFTTEAASEGGWRSESGFDFIEPTIGVSCVCDRSRYTEARQLILQIGRLLGQEAMYFEVQYFDGVEIIPLE